MPTQCFCNDDIQKLVVEILDRQHYLTVVEAEVFSKQVEGALAAGGRQVPLQLQGREYSLRQEEAKHLLASLTAQREEAEKRYGRPEPAVDVAERLAKTEAENAQLKADLAKAFQEREALHAQKGKGKL